jgi:hypothetical protein
MTMTETAMPDTSPMPAVQPSDPWMPITTLADENTNPSPDPAYHDDRLAAELVRLIRTHPAVRRAVLGVVMSCPNIRTET